MGLLLDDRPDPVVLAGVGCDICQDAQLGQVRVVFRVDAFELWMEGFVAGAGQAGIAFVDLGVVLDRPNGSFYESLYISDISNGLRIPP